jgi:hypothetical protein
MQSYTVTLSIALDAESPADAVDMLVQHLANDDRDWVFQVEDDRGKVFQVEGLSGEVREITSTSGV